MQIKVQWIAAAGADIVSVIDAPVATGVITCDHAASSYGLPVVVRDDGAALGPAEISDGLRVTQEADSPEEQALLLAAGRAGYTVVYGNAVCGPER